MMLRLLLSTSQMNIKEVHQLLTVSTGRGQHKKLFSGEVGDVMQLGEEVHVKRVFWAALTSRMR